MPPSESDILNSYLLHPAPLAAIVTYERFCALFPRALQDDPAAEQRIRSLWRDLQAQRGAVVDDVAQAIADEVKRGAAVRREVVRAQREAEGADEADAEVELERALFGDESGVRAVKHSLSSIVPELDGAAGAVEAEVDKLREEEAALTESIQQTVGRLSDLRYGKFANSQLKDEVFDGLASLQSTCEGKS